MTSQCDKCPSRQVPGVVKAQGDSPWKKWLENREPDRWMGTGVCWGWGEETGALGTGRNGRRRPVAEKRACHRQIYSPPNSPKQ